MTNNMSFKDLLNQNKSVKEEKKEEIVLPKTIEEEKPNPFAALKQTINKPVEKQESKPNPQPIVNDNTSTIPPDLSNFSFDDQPEAFDGTVVEQFHNQIQQIQEALSNPDIRMNITNTMQFIKSHEELRDIISHSDVRVMVSALQKGYGVAIDKRNSNKAKAKKAGKHSEDVAAAFSNFAF